MLDLKLVYNIGLHHMHEDKHLNNVIQTINHAYEVSKRILKGAYNTVGIKAGETHFSDVWIRDSAFASWGALKVNDIDIVENFIMHVFDHMNDAGQCPLRIGQKYFLLKYFGLKGPEGPTYIEDKYVSIPMDSNALMIGLCFKLLKTTEDKSFIRDHFHHIIKAIGWYDTYLDNNLVVEGPYAGWADSLKKQGKVLYTNILYYKALLAMSDIANIIGEKDVHQTYKKKAEQTKAAIIDLFWNGTYLVDWVHKGKVQDTFSVEANMFAILFNVVTNEQADTIIKYMLDNNVMTPYGCPCANKPYALKHVYPPFIPLGLKDYHNGLVWFWISCVTAVAFHHHGKHDEAVELMHTISKKIERDNTVYEVYDRDGNAVDRTFYKSERGFAWSAGLYTWAYNKLFP